MKLFSKAPPAGWKMVWSGPRGKACMKASKYADKVVGVRYFPKVAQVWVAQKDA